MFKNIWYAVSVFLIAIIFTGCTLIQKQPEPPPTVPSVQTSTESPTQSQDSVISKKDEEFSLKILSPNGGERWKMGDSETIKWNISPEVSQGAYLYFTLQRTGDSVALWSSDGIEGSDINLGIHIEKKFGYLGWRILEPGTYNMVARLFDRAPCGEKPVPDDFPCKRAKVIARDTSDAPITVHKDENTSPAQSMSPVSNPESKIIWKSQPKGDFIADTRDPLDVCENIQKGKDLSNCKLLESKSSMDRNECFNGMGVAGCFACKFECL